MKLRVAILVFLGLRVFVFAQERTQTIDSLENVMAKQEGREKVETMMELSKAFFGYSFDDCIAWGERAIEEATRFHDDELLAKAYWRMGIRYLNHFEFDLALENYGKALELLKNKGDSDLLMRVLNGKGRVELLMGDLDAALPTYQYDLKVSENLGDALNCADVMNNIAYIHFHQDDFDKAMKCFHDARQRYMHLHDTLSVAQCDNNISRIHIERQWFDEAQLLLQRAIPIYEHYGDDVSLAHAYQNLGTVYATGHVNFDSAMVCLRKSIKCAENVGDQITLIEDELELAGVMRHLNREGDAMDLYELALHSSETMGYTDGLLEAYKNLGIHYNETGDFKTSAIYLKRCEDLAIEKGNQLYLNTVRPYLIADYARLGQMMEMKQELDLVEDDYLGMVGENNALEEELSHIQYDMDGLLGKYESQNEQIQTLKTQRDQYVMAFCGLLAMLFFFVVLLVVYKIVRKKRAKIEKG